jgi:hypothetical protein
VRQRAGVFESNLIYFFKASTFQRQWLEQARRVAFTGKLAVSATYRATESQSQAGAGLTNGTYGRQTGNMNMQVSQLKGDILELCKRCNLKN